MLLLITGGKMKKSTNILKDWSRYKEGVMVIFDVENRKVLHEFIYKSPLELSSGKDASNLFSASTLVGNKIYLSACTEVLVYCLKKKQVEKAISHPLMNDVHHVNIIDDKLYVVSTGLDSILVFNQSGILEKSYYLADGDFNDRFNKSVDYRTVDSTKPHRVHPNYISKYRNEIYVTRLKQKDIIKLEKKEAFNISDSYIHDGIPYNNKLYFTSVDGKIIITDLLNEKKIIKLADIENTNEPLGWCRSILPISDSKVIVGFSILRNTKSKEFIKWAAMKMQNKNYTNKRTRIVFYDLQNLCAEKEIFIDETGIDAIYSIHELDDKVFK